MKTKLLLVLAMLAVAGWDQTAPAQVSEAGADLASEAATSSDAHVVRQVFLTRQMFRETILEMQRSGELQLAPPAGPCHGEACDGGCGDCCACECSPCCCRPCGWDAGAELAFLRPVFGPGGPIQFFGGDNQTNLGIDGPEYDYEASPRFWLGFMGCQDVGWRLRYWNFDHDSQEALLVDRDANQVITRTQSGVEGLEMDVLDAEVVFQSQWCRWCFFGSAGVRYAKATREFSELDTRFTAGVPTEAIREEGEFEFESWGPTLSLEVRRCAWGLSPFVLVRSSLLAGDFQDRSVETRFDLVGNTTDAFLNLDDEQNTMFVTEIQIGVEWTGCMSWGAMYLRAAVEAQRWERGAAILDDSQTDREEDASQLTILGGSISVGVLR